MPAFPLMARQTFVRRSVKSLFNVLNDA